MIGAAAQTTNRPRPLPGVDSLVLPCDFAPPDGGAKGGAPAHNVEDYGECVQFKCVKHTQKTGAPGEGDVLGLSVETRWRGRYG